MHGVPADAVAKSLGLTTPELKAFEQSGTPPRTLDFVPVAPLLKLSAPRLENLLRGWHPPAVDLTLWRELRQLTSHRDGLSVHCYLVWDEVTREAALFDTGLEPDLVLNAITENDLTLRQIFVTHSHFDHIDGLEVIRARHPRAHLHTSAASALPQHRNKPNDFLQLGSLRITNRETPGHAEDGATYIVGNFPEDAARVALVGDALFAGSIGGMGGGGDAARAKIREQILSLPSDTLLCPGHGPLTTVAEEKEHNPFFG